MSPLKTHMTKSGLSGIALAAMVSALAIPARAQVTCPGSDPEVVDCSGNGTDDFCDTGAASLHWTLQTSNGPSPRYDHAMAYNSTRGVTVLFGGDYRIYIPCACLDGPCDCLFAVDSGETWVWRAASADCNLNSVPDKCDIASGAAGECDANGVPDSCEHPGDFDCDGDVDNADFIAFRSCFAGPLQPPPADCGPMDLDADRDVDCADWRILRDRWTTGAPPSFPRCPRATAIPLLSAE